MESEIGNLVEQEYAARAPKAGYDGERIMASVALFMSKSIKELEGLTFELCGLQEFLKSETERVQRDIDSAMAGLKVIIDTISPWRSTNSGFVWGIPADGCFSTDAGMWSVPVRRRRF